MRARLHPRARAELLEAQRWYFDRSPLSAVAFAYEIDRAVSRIREEPERYPVADHGVRRFVLQRFPFTVFYRASENEIVIVAVAHQKRRPGYWSKRVEE
ncbi:MAG: type II toxin-antitoxin system RelE/ParE family toxin [Pyrinomonadaceae bacterium]